MSGRTNDARGNASGGEKGGGVRRGQGRKYSPRRLAYEALLRQQRGSYANLALKEVLAEAGGTQSLSPQNRAFLTALFYGALERQLTLEYYFQALSKGRRIPLPIRCILMLGGAQLLYMDVPARAAIDESVKLCKELGKGANGGFVNALLRELDRRREDLPRPQGNEAENLSIQYSYPVWLVERLLTLLGRDEAEAFMAGAGPGGGGFPPGMSVRANGTKITAEELDAALKARGIPALPGRLMPEARYVQLGGDVGALDLFAEGKLAVQGESSMLVGRVAGARGGMCVLDACAAPGGKTAYMAAEMGAGELLAWDIHPHRVALIQKNCNRLGLDWVRAEVQDATVFRPELEAAFDMVLVDAPCSGLGVLAEKPDIKYSREPAELAELLPLQKAILDNCARYVKPGGRLVYATCTILPEENEDQVRVFLRENPAFEREDMTEKLPEGLKLRRRKALKRSERSQESEGSELQLWPQRDGVAGFYMVCMRRKSRAKGKEA